MATRLDRLFVLLDTGSTPLIRKSAAEQLGTVQRLHPHELNNLLGKILVYLRSPSWDTRVAAGQAVNAICQNVPQWRPEGLDNNDDDCASSRGFLTFEEFALEKVLTQGAALLGSEGAEYEPFPAEKEVDAGQRLVNQRRELNRRLGLDVSGGSLGHLVEDQDLLIKPELTIDTGEKCNISRLVEEQVDVDPGLSARERNRAKRKAKLLSRKLSVEPKNGENEESQEPPSKRFRSHPSSPVIQKSASDVSRLDQEETVNSPLDSGEESEWPFQWFCAQLIQDLFHASWEVRHGAATGLRDVIKHHGRSAGRSMQAPKAQMDSLNESWLTDCSLRLMCVMALDRFGDFISDEVVAPVRESCAQALGSVVHCMRPGAVEKVLAVLLSLFSQSSWEVRHGGLLGIKYLLATRQDLTGNLLPSVLPSVMGVLRDSDDDVRAVAAASLVSVVDCLKSDLPAQVPHIVAALWDALLDLDDLTASTNSVMALLSALLNGAANARSNAGPLTTQQPETTLNHSISLSVLVPRLWPFFRHSIASVRFSSLQTLLSLLQAHPQNVMNWLPPILHDLLRHLFQRALLENYVDVRNLVEKVWYRLVDVSPVEALISVPWYSLWLCLLMQPDSTPYDRNMLIDAHHRMKDHSDQKGHKKDQTVKDAPEYIGGAEVEDRDTAATQARLLGARMLAYLFCKACQPVGNYQSTQLNGANTSTIVSDVTTSKSSDHGSSDVELKGSDGTDVKTDSTVVKTSNEVNASTSDVVKSSTSVYVKQEVRTEHINETKTELYEVGSGESKLEIKEEFKLEVKECAKIENVEMKGDVKEDIAVSQPVETLREVVCGLLLFHLKSNSAMQRIISHLVIREWALLDQDCVDAAVIARLQQSLIEPCLYDELALLFTSLQTECNGFIASLNQRGADVGKIFQPGPVISVEMAQSLLTNVYEQVIVQIKVKFHDYFNQRRSQISTTLQHLINQQRALTLRVSASLSGCMVCLKCLPTKMNPIIRPLMDTLKTEENEQLQVVSAENLARVLTLCVEREPCPNKKVVNNLCSFVVREPLTEDSVGPAALMNWSDDSLRSGIITLRILQELGDKKTRAGKKNAPSNAGQTQDEESSSKRLIQDRGARIALATLIRHFSQELRTKLPSLYDAMFDILSRDIKIPVAMVAKDDIAMETDAESAQSSDRLSPDSSVDDVKDDVEEDVRDDVKTCDVKLTEDETEKSESLCQSLQIFEIGVPELRGCLQDKVQESLEPLKKCLHHPTALVRYRAARCSAALCRLWSGAVNHVIKEVVPMLGESCAWSRSGAVELIYFLMTQLGADLVPYLSLLVAPLLGRMSDQYQPVRQVAALSFATLVQLLPLEPGSSCPPDLPEELRSQRSRDREFVRQLLHPGDIKPYYLPVPIDATLRAYQQDGLNWLNFLNIYNLHGILCDDMGLGKSLQSICVLAADLHNRREKYEATQREDCRPVPSLIVCPSTLVNHWMDEIEKFVKKSVLNPAAYRGLPLDRKRLQAGLDKHDVIVASYEIVRNDVNFFRSVHWNYCILDEGHIIKNTKAKITRSIKQLRCNHRLILTGTPIQNNVLELWSLFDFLMPGFLGTERQFMASYAKPIQQSREAKSTSKEHEAGALALERLHRQVLPFILRRLKEDVLKDLPPKIIQDYTCELSKLQVELYEEFTSSQNLDMDDSEDIKKNQHVFQAIQYLRKVCAHPSLVLTPSHPQYDNISQRLKQESSSLNDFHHSCKLVALRQLLWDCGIGAPSGCEVENETVVNAHRVLIFCQLKSMLNIVEEQLFNLFAIETCDYGRTVSKVHMKDVTYLRLDGSVPAESRMSVVSRFNNDPSIDVLLLTTQVGGLGLNLTGADTVIFVEHDWNPMKDLQAMDRAHRIGQKKVVNVYRLISRGTLEEKIMGLQKFKMSVANTVVTQENSSMDSMATGQVLDLFSLGDQKEKTSRKNNSGKQSLKSILENLNEMWSEDNYAEEFQLDSFIASLPKS